MLLFLNAAPSLSVCGVRRTGYGSRTVSTRLWPLFPLWFLSVEPGIRMRILYTLSTLCRVLYEHSRSKGLGRGLSNANSVSPCRGNGVIFMPVPDRLRERPDVSLLTLGAESPRGTKTKRWARNQADRLRSPLSLASHGLCRRDPSMPSPCLGRRRRAPAQPGPVETKVAVARGSEDDDDNDDDGI